MQHLRRHAAVYGGTEHANVYGGTARASGQGIAHVSVHAYYHPPTYPLSAVPYYSTGCYGCPSRSGPGWSRRRRGGSFRQHSRGDIERVCRRCGNRQREHGGTYNAGVSGIAAAARRPPART